MSLGSDFPRASIPVPVHPKFKQRKCETFLFEAALFVEAKAKKDVERDGRMRWRKREEKKRQKSKNERWKLTMNV